MNHRPCRSGPNRTDADPGLLDASRAITEELDLDRVLARIAQAAVALVGGRYGALGVIDAEGMLERFIHVGIDEDTAAAIGHLPEGHGLLGAVIDTAQTIRLPRLGDDPRSVGFPEHHPPMASFLGVPIRVRNEVYGNLYVTDQRTGAFTADDEDLIESLAVTAGIAIENARLYDEARRQQRLSLALSEISSALLSPGAGDVLGVVAERLAHLVPADLVTIVVPSDAEHVRIDIARGADSAALEGMLLPAAAVLATKAIDTGTTVAGSFLDEDPATAAGHRWTGSTAAAPLVAAGHAIGALCVSRPDGDGFTPGELTTISEFATQAGLAISLAWAHRDRQRLEVIEDRSRIARDLHDHVIQRLFATGLRLQALATMEPAHADELEVDVTELDAAIADIRTAIFNLRSRPPNDTRELARHRLLDVVNELTPTLSHAPRITFSGPIDLTLTGTLADDVVAVVREALANMARHANADHAEISVTVTAEQVIITVDDDGDGISPTATRSSGTANLAHRAAEHGGTFSLSDGPDGGTRVRWAVPLPA
ncbi:two-component system sensor protein [Leifsonia xyli subsp. cynodontis DSM 46306]|uniref:Histidine kinase n=1 Tax=Leifsonia xyli subsp. cynodontis DSM 46306 TaxID=1389489 RepID=U3P439_LEIXC|nr:two-component system sensor protein [Leifsonia xyli subsp. cynodontis DSM 46306]